MHPSSKLTTMKHTITVQDLLFDVAQVPVEAVVGTNGNPCRISIPGKKALIHKVTGHVLGVVSQRDLTSNGGSRHGKPFPRVIP